MKYELTDAERDKVCRGELCPNCKKQNVESTGCAPDFIHVNERFECKDCGAGWEGY